MKTFEIKKILVPTDFSETGLLALDHATFMARLFKADLYLLHVVESFEYAYSNYEPEIMLKDFEEVQEAMTEKIERLAAKLSKENGININTRLANGRPYKGITESAKENDIDIIVMGTHGAKGFEEFILGSNSQKVVTHAECPVITLQTHAKSIGFKNIVMPIDNSLHSREKVGYVIKMAKHYGSKIHVLGLSDSTDEVDERKFNTKLDTVEHALKHAGIPYEIHMVHTHNIASEAMKFSEEIKADLLVIMADHESSIAGKFLGSMAKQIVNHSRIPVMSIKANEKIFGFDLSVVNPFY